VYPLETTQSGRRNSISKFARCLPRGSPGENKEVDDLRFVAECDPERGFVPLEIECCACGSRIDPLTQRKRVSLICPGCKNTAKLFWAEAQMGVFLAENWNALRQVCSQSRLCQPQTP